MCGIVGYISTKDELASSERQNFLRYALMIDTLRGADSTGLMTVHDKFAVSTLKSTAPGFRFVELDEFRAFDTNGWAAVGHNRAATAGSVKVENAHPFQFGAVTMVHNGTLFNRGKAMSTFKAGLDVDSMQIAYALSEETPEKAKKVLEEIDGSFALVWFDERDESINFARNKDRPLHATWNKKQTFMTFMSDGYMLKTLNNSLKDSRLRGESILSIDAGRHCKLHKGSLVPEVTAFTPFTFQVYTGQRTYTPPPQKNETTGLSSQADKWRERLRQRQAEDRKKRERTYIPSCVTDLGATSGLVQIAGKKRPIPEAHKYLLGAMYTLDPKERLEFKVTKTVQIGQYNMMAFGEFTHAHWSLPDRPSKWSAVIIHNLAMAEVKAYSYRSWTVSPIGLTHPTDNHDGMPSVLCKLLNYDWEREQHENAKRIKYSDPDKLDPGSLIQFNGRLKSVASVTKMLDRGCIQCGCNLFLHEIDEYVVVNDGVDVMCGGCKADSETRMH